MDELFERGRNSFSILRLLLAAAVIVSHSFYLPGYGMDPLEQWSGLRLGEVAVDGFFALSGMLVATSLQGNGDLSRFIRHRMARLMPGFWVCLLFCAFVLSPITVVIDLGWNGLFKTSTFASFFGYVIKNSALLVVEPTLPNVLSGLSYRRINPCLWSLAPEACCYVLLASAWVLRLLDGKGRSLILLFAFLLGLMSLSGIAVHLLAAIGGAPLIRLIELGLHFLSGVLTVLYLKRLRLSVVVAICLMVTYGVCLAYEPLQFLRILFFAPMLAVLARVIPLHGRCDTLDISYGLYLYGSALQQVMVWLGFTGPGPWSFFVLSFSVAVPIALLSWILIEKPALRRWSKQRVNPFTIMPDRA
ncbi:acyltransferase [Dyella sp. S184]|uniref:acyltransferase family protein n=1 Tax=Dyella sp. S184 TaxID=1641862 RepID=UPI00131E3467|nr:acyltransferase [Dyella sp. S184]